MFHGFLLRGSGFGPSRHRFRPECAASAQASWRNRGIGRTTASRRNRWRYRARMPSIFPVLRLRLWHRLLIAFVALSGGVLLGFVAWQLQAFRGRFVDYLDAVALQRLEPA